MTQSLTAVDVRLRALVEPAAQDVLADGRAELVITTERALWALPVSEGEGEGEGMLALLPKAPGAVAVGVLRGEVTDQRIVGTCPEWTEETFVGLTLDEAARPAAAQGCFVEDCTGPSVLTADGNRFRVRVWLDAEGRIEHL